MNFETPGMKGTRCETASLRRLERMRRIRAGLRPYDLTQLGKRARKERARAAARPPESVQSLTERLLKRSSIERIFGIRF